MALDHSSAAGRANLLTSLIGAAAGAVSVAAIIAALCDFNTRLEPYLGFDIARYGHWLEPYRQLFLVAAAGTLLLGFGVLFTTPQLTPSGSIRMGRFGKIVLWSATVAFGVAYATPAVVEWLL